MPYDWYGRVDQPVARALHIVTWATGAGYVLDKQGGFQAINGAPALSVTGTNEAQMVRAEDGSFVNVATFYGLNVANTLGLPYWSSDRYVDWSWNPDGSGQGYALDHYGQLHPFGGASKPSRAGTRWTAPVARALSMRWAGGKRAITLDMSGGLHSDFGAVIGGAVITETVFGWRGMGALFRDGLLNRDPNPVMAFFLVTAVLVVIFNLIADIAYAYLDPRIRLS